MSRNKMIQRSRGLCSSPITDYVGRRDYFQPFLLNYFIIDVAFKMKKGVVLFAMDFICVLEVVRLIWRFRKLTFVANNIYEKWVMMTHPDELMSDGEKRWVWFIDEKTVGSEPLTTTYSFIIYNDKIINHLYKYLLVICKYRYLPNNENQLWRPDSIGLWDNIVLLLHVFKYK